MIRGLISVDRARSAAPFEPLVRDRVIDRIAAAAAFPVVVIVASAGFGKTLALRQFLERERVEHAAFDVRREHTTFPAFLAGLVAALGPAGAGNAADVPSIVARAAGAAAPLDELAAWFALLLRGYRGTIAIDDLHLAAADERVTGFLSRAIERADPGTRWLLSSRASVDLPIATWLAYGRADMPVDDDDLRLTSDEALAIVHRSGGRLSRASVEELLRLTDRWPAAFTFALRASARTQDLARVASGTREMMYAFLAEQVYAEFDEPTRAFLRETALLETLTPRIVERVGGVQRPPEQQAPSNGGAQGMSSIAEAATMAFNVQSVQQPPMQPPTQASTAMIAQANQSQQNVLSLLK